MNLLNRDTTLKSIKGYYEAAQANAGIGLVYYFEIVDGEKSLSKFAVCTKDTSLAEVYKQANVLPEDDKEVILTITSDLDSKMPLFPIGGHIKKENQ